MDTVNQLEKLYKDKLLKTYFNNKRPSRSFYKCDSFTKEFLYEFYNTLMFFKNCVFEFGCCRDAESVKEIYDITNTFLYKKLFYSIKNYCRENGITFEVKDNSLFVGGRAITDGKEFLLDIFEIDELLSSTQVYNDLSESDSKLDLARAHRDYLNKMILNTNNLDTIFDSCVNSNLFDNDFVFDYYMNKSNEVSNSIDFKKLPASIVNVDFINNASRGTFNDVNLVITSLLTKYCSDYNIPFETKDNCIYLDGDIIGTNEGYFFDVFELDFKVSLLTKENRLSRGNNYGI